MMIGPDRLSEIERIVSYKYFGDYEFTDEQRLAVQDLLAFAKHVSSDTGRPIPTLWIMVARYAAERGLTVYDVKTRRAEFQRIVTPEAVLAEATSTCGTEPKAQSPQTTPKGADRG